MIGAGHAGLAVSRLLAAAGPRARRPGARPGRRAVADRAVGFAAPADAELDDPAARLALPRSGSGRVPAAPAAFAAVPRPTTPPRSTLPSIGSANGRGACPRAAAVRSSVPGRHGSGHLARPARGHRDRPARHAAYRPAAVHAREVSRWSPRSSTAIRRNCRPVACSSSAPRRRACRSPTSWPERAARWCSPSGGTPGCPAATAAWTSSGGCRAPAGWPARSTTCPTPRPRAASRPRSWSDEPAERPRPGRPAGPRGVRLAGRLERVAGGRAWFRRRPRRHGRGRRSADAPLPRRRRRVRRPVRPRAASSARRRGRGRSTCRRRRRRWTCAPRESAPCCSPPATARITRGCGCRSPARTAASRSTAASPPRPGSTWSGSASSIAATPDSSTAPGTTRETVVASPAHQAGDAHAGAGLAGRGAGDMNRYDVVVVGGRVAGASTALLLARAGPRVALVDRRRPGSDTVSTHGLMRAGVLQLSRWGLLDRVVAAGTPPIRSTTFHYADGRARCVAIRPERRRRRAVRAAPPPARLAARRRGRAGRRRRAHRDDGDRAACATRPAG